MVEEMLASLQADQENLKERVTKLESDSPILAALKIQMDTCELMHKEARAVAERTEAALNNNTKASEEQTKALNDLTETVKAVAVKVEKEIDPVVNRSRVFQKWWDRIADWFDINRIALTWIGKWIVGPVLTLGALAVALKQLGVW